MKLFSLIAGLTFSFSALAHLHPGTYTGTTHEGTACSFTVKHVEYAESRHPLNERATVEVEGETFVLSHPAVIDTESKKLSFNHDLLSGAKGRGPISMVAHLHMEHSETKDGPSHFMLMRDDRTLSTPMSVWHCGNLVPPAQNDSH